MSDTSVYDLELAIEKLKKHKSSGNKQIPSEFVGAGDRTIRRDICTLINSIWNKDNLPEESKQSITVPIYKKGDKTLW